MKKITDYWDEEIGCMIKFFNDYFILNKKILSKDESYQLGLLSNNYHFYIRLLKAKLNKQNLSQIDIEDIKNIKKITKKFPDLESFLIEKYEIFKKDFYQNNPQGYLTFYKNINNLN